MAIITCDFYGNSDVKITHALSSGSVVYIFYVEGTDFKMQRYSYQTATEAATVATNITELAGGGGGVGGGINNEASSRAPSAGDDEDDGYAVGSLWFWTTNLSAGNFEAYRCLDATADAAEWLNSTLTIDELGSIAVRNSDEYVRTSLHKTPGLWLDSGDSPATLPRVVGAINSIAIGHNNVVSGSDHSIIIGGEDNTIPDGGRRNTIVGSNSSDITEEVWDGGEKQQF